MSPTLLRVVRVFRVFRVLRVVRAARGIRRLILTLVISIPALFNIAVLLSVFLVIFAILGQFRKLKKDQLKCFALNCIFKALLFKKHCKTTLIFHYEQHFIVKPSYRDFCRNDVIHARQTNRCLE